MSKTQLFIEKARAVHGDRYDYSKTVYVRGRDGVTITCKEHGDFEQIAADHLTGVGCPRCLWDRDQPTAVYLMQMGDTVLDFTMGSGSTGVACRNLNRKFIGIEMDENYFNIATQRIVGSMV